MLHSLALYSLGLSTVVVRAVPVVGELSAQVKQEVVTVNGTLEYSAMCKTCPYNLCPNVEIPDGGDTVTLTCWANGDTIDDTNLWLKTTSNCYISEYDLVEYAGDFSAELKSCGKIPMEITKQAAKIKYLSVCKWGRGTSSESLEYYGRDKDITLTCWAEGGDVMNDVYWYKTIDNCHVSGSGLWKTPNRDSLDNCGPAPGARMNETKRALEDDDAHFALPDIEKDSAEEARREENDSKSILARRWLQPEQIGEEYGYCRSCGSPVTSSTCKQIQRYEYNQTVVSQCFLDNSYTYPNGTVTSFTWVYTTDWCFVDSNDFWIPPWDHYRYPSCRNWGIS